ncbi:hypothetical protein [Tepidibacter hydrothermalis]|uniref:Phage protein n=1 Tax=Tepidibacter hydrothermalis TaxID=3036126 RepID=A0ABY8E9Z2_9FIRM|nr:hypothetical protein [Tepidibacter hydrothermalis]WFD09752.1 hypothetical protein P4S50_15345 [Tepidibacter hydrothermalis]
MKIDKELYKKVEWTLYNYKALNESIGDIQLEIEELKIDTDGVRGISYDTERISPTYNITSITEDAAIRKIETIEKLEKQIAKNKITIQKIDRALKSLDEVERKIVEGKYIERLQWWQIEELVKYSGRWCREKRDRSIGKISAKLFANHLNEETDLIKLA